MLADIKPPLAFLSHRFRCAARASRRFEQFQQAGEDFAHRAKVAPHTLPGQGKYVSRGLDLAPETGAGERVSVQVTA